MKKTAGILKVFWTIGIVLEILMIIVLGAVGAMVLSVGSFSQIAESSGGAITLSTGGEISAAELDALKPLILVAILVALVGMIFGLLGSLTTRKAISEVKEERPFSQTSIDAIKRGGKLEIVGGIVGFISSLMLYFWAASLTIGGVSIGSTSFSYNFTFVLRAVELYMLYYVAVYGKSLEDKLEA